MKIHFLSILTFIVLATINLSAQKLQYSRQDSLRGTITPERAWWDLSYYHLDIAVDPANKSIKGKNTIIYKVLEDYNVMQIDLQPPLRIFNAIQDGEELEIIQEGNAHFIHLQGKQEPDVIKELTVYYGGIPVEAVRPPWDGGITWSKDENGIPFVASSCQGLGASVWWPCKDHMYDEPDSMLISVNVPEKLMNISNGD